MPGPYSQWRVAELAGEHVKVLIDGQGADELAGGYMYFLPVMWRQISLLKKIQYFPDLFATIVGNRHMFRQYPFLLIWERVVGKNSLNNELPFQPEWRNKFSDERPVWEKFESVNPMLLSAITQSSLPALLRYSDRDNMAFGVENRSPFLDHRLVEYVMSLPADMKLRGGTTKWIFRKIAVNRVPAQIIKRRLKMGFPTPVGEWIRKELFEAVQLWFKSYAELNNFSRWIDIREVSRLIAEHAGGKERSSCTTLAVDGYRMLAKEFRI